jgi:hypothetical protein
LGSSMESSNYLSSIGQRENARKKLVQRNPGVLKVQDAIEHIIVTGAKVRRDNWRRHEFERREQNRSLAAALECPPLDVVAMETKGEKRRKRRRQLPTTVCHAEDLRIYGTGYKNRFPTVIPTQSRSSSSSEQTKQQHRSDDTEWNLEHGDSIPPILFRMARLSQEYPSEEQLLRFNDKKATFSKSLTSTDVTLDEQDVPRALIERCWERAVHLASNAISVPVTAATETTATTARSAPPTYHGSSSKQASSLVHFDSNTPLSQESCREKCESLGVDIESLRDATRTTEASAAVSETTCPRCTRSFATTDELLNHFYGNTETIGCCRALIRPRHLDLIRNLLQNYAESQTDQLSSILLSQAEADPSKNKSDDHRNDDSDTPSDGNAKPKAKDHTKRKGLLQHLDWRDVRRFLENAIDDSTPIPTEVSTKHRRTDAMHPVQQSMHITSTRTTITGNDKDTTTSPRLPLMLNPMVLEAVGRRLIDRYADVPR